MFQLDSGKALREFISAATPGSQISFRVISCDFVDRFSEHQTIHEFTRTHTNKPVLLHFS